MSCLQAVISGKDLEPLKEISVQLSKHPLHTSIMSLQIEVNKYLTQLVKNPEDEDIDNYMDASEAEESDFEVEYDEQGLETYLNRDLAYSRLVKKYKKSDELKET